MRTCFVKGAPHGRAEPPSFSGRSTRYGRHRAIPRPPLEGSSCPAWVSARFQPDFSDPSARGAMITGVTTPLASSPKSTAVGAPVSRHAGSAGVTGWGRPTPSGRPDAQTGEEPCVAEGARRSALSVA
jgi:hypothetical protein